MPLRDHFRPPVYNQASWEGFHAVWPVVMVQQLQPKLPDAFTAEPRVHLGTNFEIVCAYEGEEELSTSADDGAGGTATATLVAPAPTRVLEVELTEEYAYEVLIFDQNRRRELVAAIEIV